jgi:hypothetical protein
LTGLILAWQVAISSDIGPGLSFNLNLLKNMAKWIKIETHTPDKVEVRQIARLCGCTRAEAFLALFHWFVWLDEQTESGDVDFFTPADADEIGGLAGLGNALETVRWVKFNASGAVISNWKRHNGKSAKRRCIDMERKQEERN